MSPPHAGAGVIPIMALHVAFGIAYFLTAQAVLNMKLVAPSAQPLTGMIYFADAARDERKDENEDANAADEVSAHGVGVTGV